MPSMETFVFAFAVALLAEGVDRNSIQNHLREGRNRSPSSRRAWIEIAQNDTKLPPRSSSPSSRRAWIEISCSPVTLIVAVRSPSSRRAWIEIPRRGERMRCCPVALLAEGVDRNILDPDCKLPHQNVALLAEGVDRNRYSNLKPCVFDGSPSSRRAWIEIKAGGGHPLRRSVALLAEGVDRNLAGERQGKLALMSPSSRRAWIEIVSEMPAASVRCGSPSSRRAWIEMMLGNLMQHRHSRVALLAEGVDRNMTKRMGIRDGAVALLAEGVDRNLLCWLTLTRASCRPPRGGRG